MGGGRSSTATEGIMPSFPPMTDKEREDFERDNAHETADFKEFVKTLRAYYSDTLDQRERNAIKQFLGQYYSEINDSLSKNDAGYLTPGQERIVRILDSVFKKSPKTTTDFTAFRTLKGLRGFGLSTSARSELVSILKSGDKSSLTTFIDSYFKGGSLSAKGYSLTTTKKANAETIAVNNGIVMRIRVPAGSRGLYTTKEISGKRYEYLLNRGSSFTIRGGDIGYIQSGNIRKPYLILDADLK